MQWIVIVVDFELSKLQDRQCKVYWAPNLWILKTDFNTRYDFVTCNLLTTSLLAAVFSVAPPLSPHKRPYDTLIRHIVGHDFREVLKHVLKSYNFFRVVKEVACDKITACKSAIRKKWNDQYTLNYSGIYQVGKGWKISRPFSRS